MKKNIIIALLFCLIICNDISSSNITTPEDEKYKKFINDLYSGDFPLKEGYKLAPPPVNLQKTDISKENPLPEESTTKSIDIVTIPSLNHDSQVVDEKPAEPITTSETGLEKVPMIPYTGTEKPVEQPLHHPEPIGAHSTETVYLQDEHDSDGEEDRESHKNPIEDEYGQGAGLDELPELDFGSDHSHSDSSY